MIRKICDVAVIGAGPAGLAAAVAARKEGAEHVIVIERDKKPGGILQQCIHPGFGLTLFKEELTGPEYAHRFIVQAKEENVEFLFNSMVLEVNEHQVTCLQEENGVVVVEAKSIVLAMGCRERTRPGIRIPGTRPAGVYTAGAAQRLINRQNKLVGRNIVILGSGDIGMIMARRLTLEGAKVLAVVEIMDYLAGLTRNRVQCLDDFGIPLYLSHTVTKVEGNERVTGVRVAKVDENKKPIPETTEAEIRKMSPPVPHTTETYKLHRDVMAPPRQTRIWVRNPAALPWRPRSFPITPPATTARAMRSRTLTMLNSCM